MNTKITIKEIREVVQELIKERLLESINSISKMEEQWALQYFRKKLVYDVVRDFNNGVDYYQKGRKNKLPLRYTTTNEVLEKLKKISTWESNKIKYLASLYNGGSPFGEISLYIKIYKENGKIIIQYGSRLSNEEPKVSLNENKHQINERMTYAELYDNTDDNRLNRSNTVRVRPLNVETENGNEMWKFSYTSAERSEFKKYGGKMAHKGNIHFFKDSIEPGDNAEDLECMVDCDCKDFKFRWAWANAEDDASFIGGKSLNKADNRPPNRTNPVGSGEGGGRRKQLCKHLAGLAKYLITDLEKSKQRAGLRKKPVNIFEEMDRLANQGRFQATYLDNE